MNKLSPQHRKIEAVFLMSEEATVKDLYAALYGDAEGRTNRELSQRIGPALSRYHKATGNDVQPTGTPYTYKLVYA